MVDFVGCHARFWGVAGDAEGSCEAGVEGEDFGGGDGDGGFVAEEGVGVGCAVFVGLVSICGDALGELGCFSGGER